MTKTGQAAATFLTTLTLTVLARVNTPTATHTDTSPGGDRDRGDVPGWVMITVMTVTIDSPVRRPVRPQLPTFAQGA